MESLVFQTPLGYAVFARHDEVLFSLSIGHSSERAAVKDIRARVEGTFLTDTLFDPAEDELAQRVFDFASGAATAFDDIVIDLEGRTPFQRRVIDACRAIPWGETRTYGELAREAGKPGAARAVGSVMASNRTLLVVPCHRVVRASGGKGKFSAPQGEAMRQRIIDLERADVPLLVN